MDTSAVKAFWLGMQTPGDVAPENVLTITKLAVQQWFACCNMHECLSWLQGRQHGITAEISAANPGVGSELQHGRDEPLPKQTAAPGESLAKPDEGMVHSLDHGPADAAASTSEHEAVASNVPDDAILVNAAETNGVATPPATVAGGPPRSTAEPSEALLSPDAAAVNVFSNPLYSVAR